MEPHTETPQRQIVVCHGINCRRSGAPELMEQLQQALAQDETVEITRYNCFGACAAAPNVVVVPDRLWYSFAMPEYGDHVVEAIRRGAALPGLANHVRPEVADAVFHTLEARQSEL
jgi:NADH:ubiquinone oxidoreductase subunit E